jgi:hypothetical protein
MNAPNREYYYDPDRAPDRRMRSEGTVSKTWKCTNIQAIHHEITRLLFKGWSNVRIAKELNVSETMISLVKNSPAIKAKLAILEHVADGKAMDIREELQRRAPAALETLTELMSGENTTPSLKAKIAMDHLDRAGFAPVRQIESKNLHAHRFIDEEDIKNLKKRAMELARLNQLIPIEEIEDGV